MSEQQINPDNSLDIAELDQVTGGVVVHETRATSNDLRRNQEQADKLTAKESEYKTI